jgi:hypothetical protein
MDVCLPLGEAMLLAICAIPYRLTARRDQAVNRHFLHGFIGGLFSIAITNFVERADRLQAKPQAWLLAVYLGGLLAVPILLGCLSRRDAKQKEREELLTDNSAA